MLFFQSPKIYTCSSKGILENAILVVEENGIIKDIIEQSNSIPKDKIEYLTDPICPGFVNAHCHLELSYLHQKIEVKKGLNAFIKAVEKHKIKDKDLIVQHALVADKWMYKEGISAVGDICNTDYTIGVKSNSPIHYHSFIETFAFNPERAKIAIENSEKLLRAYQNEGLSASITPHAPYSASTILLQAINASLNPSSDNVSIHNQESEEENDFFRFKIGTLLDRLEHFGISHDHFVATGLNSLPSVMKYFHPDLAMILVHNTVSKAEDIAWMQSYANKVYWCFCPKANLYIEDKLPNFSLFKKQNCSIVIGTDSLASNDQLSILDEIHTILQYDHSYSFEALLEAACINGAKALGINDKFGSIEVGKKPGIVCLIENERIAKRLI
jgi:aminodeoxyfutalosine deaminase